ncbi:hypothetical protein GCM10017744_074040 [Streptomyces antimycoticus]
MGEGHAVGSLATGGVVVVAVGVQVPDDVAVGVIAAEGESGVAVAVGAEVLEDVLRTGGADQTAAGALRSSIPETVQ